MVKKTSPLLEVNQAINLKHGRFWPKSIYKKEKKKKAINLLSKVYFFIIPLPLNNVWSMTLFCFRVRHYVDLSNKHEYFSAKTSSRRDRFIWIGSLPRCFRVNLIFIVQIYYSINNVNLFFLFTMAPNQTSDVREKYAAELSDHSNHSPMTQLLYVCLIIYFTLWFNTNFWKN